MEKFMKEMWRDRAYRLKKCKPYILVFSILFALAQLLGSTLAWFTTADTRVNAMETSAKKHYATHAVDVFDPVKTEDGWYNKRVGAANIGEKPSFVRLLVTAIFEIPSSTPGGPPILLPATIGDPDSDALVIMKDYNDNDWIDATDTQNGGDGYYYYKYILQPGESTDIDNEINADHNLFNRIVLADSLPPEYNNARLIIEVKCEAVGTRPSTQYVEIWWNGEIPVYGSVLDDVYEALQLALLGP